jgi:hypothetical protein
MTNSTAHTITILKIANCGKLTLPEDRTLTYNIGYHTADKGLLVRITDNVTGGLFSSEWIALSDILITIAKRSENTERFNAKIFTILYKSQSANNAGFLAAALKAEGILLPHKASKRLHEMGDATTFERSMQNLIKDTVSLPDVVAERDAAKAKVQTENAAKLAANRSKTAAVKSPAVKPTTK